MPINVAGIVDRHVDTGVRGGRELVDLARSAVTPAPDGGSATTLAKVVGPEGAVTAVEVAGAFQMINRVVEATGLPVLPSHREQGRAALESIGANELPHSGLATAQRPTGLVWRLRKRLRR